MSEFNLSDEILADNFIATASVREFIKLLKEGIEWRRKEWDKLDINKSDKVGVILTLHEIVYDLIDKLAGDKLI